MKEKYYIAWVARDTGERLEIELNERKTWRRLKKIEIERTESNLDGFVYPRWRVSEWHLPYGYTLHKAPAANPIIKFGKLRKLLLWWNNDMAVFFKFLNEYQGYTNIFDALEVYECVCKELRKVRKPINAISLVNLFAFDNNIQIYKGEEENDDGYR